MSQEQAVADERRRVVAINKLTEGFPDIAARAIGEGWDVTRAELETLRAAKNRHELDSIRATRESGYHVVAGRASGPTNHKDIEAAILVRSGKSAIAEKTLGPEIMERSQRLARRSFVDICAAALQIDGKEVPLNHDQIIRASLSGGSLATALSGVTNKVLEQSYKALAPTWRTWCDVQSSPDFKTNHSIHANFLGNLAVLPDGATMVHGTIDDSVTEWRLQTFAKQYKIGRQAIINDDLSLFAQTLGEFSNAASRALSELVYYRLLSATSSYFDSTLGNVLSGGGSVLSATSLATAVKQMRLQVDAAGNSLDISPAVLLVGPTLETAAKTLLQSSELLATLSSTPAPTGNALQNIVQCVVEPRIERGATNPATGETASGSTTQWFLFASPSQLPGIVGFLQNAEVPQTKTYGMFEVPGELAVSMEVFHDFECQLCSYRGAQRSAGA